MTSKVPDKKRRARSVDRRSQRQTRGIRLGRPAVPVDLDHTSSEFELKETD
ncbi:hypothetical protein [Rhizobium tumorigenes]|uniref:Uncharacterized protein n=1 Tax=Rhizobium tumorigenes TaxID=2041385 RepID=A0AAF1K979_9HYPH|nr:hypothetical protein [Rhizobium tumorigenes]WFR94907.1 hypothetical protein PR017_14005 [Rhizobium tumorigenes]